MLVALVCIRFGVCALATMPLHLVRVAKSIDVSFDIIRGPDFGVKVKIFGRPSCHKLARFCGTSWYST